MILYIHGFASCGLSNKSRALQDYFAPKQVLMPDLPHEPTQAIALLESLLQQHPVDLLVGSSLGGYYATWLNHQQTIPSVLVNPAIAPFVLLNDHLGEHTDCYGTQFNVEPKHLDILRRYQRQHLRTQERYLVLLQTGDEILDYRQAADYYAAKEVVIEQGGDHRMTNFADYLPHIAAWYQQHAGLNLALPSHGLYFSSF